MDILYSIVYYSAISSAVFILYFWLIKKRNVDGSYKGAGEYHFQKKKKMRPHTDDNF